MVTLWLSTVSLVLEKGYNPIVLSIEWQFTCALFSNMQSTLVGVKSHA